MALEYVIEQSGALKDPPDKLSRQMKKNGATAINDCVRPAWDMVRKPIPVGPSGLNKAIKMKRATIGGLEAMIHANHPLVDLVEEKTDPHVIMPRGSVSDMVAGTSKKALRFKVRGRIVFAKKINHPGTKGKFSWLIGSRFVKATLAASIQAAVEAAMNGRDYSSGGKVYVNNKTPIPVH